ncbi:GGDEF domain-containing protein [uncultured Aquitalea sp.]|uniref:GGDEF domain-containing protein n=1 Tax=uncultured Aquitalea sp. TaxID=540272 RepID=UPI0025FC102D|nr:GGDEF domain-containing protein [uncultured Aquitalea sp.]
MGHTPTTANLSSPLHIAVVRQWVELGVNPELSGAVRRRQYITNAVPGLVLLMVFFYFLLFLWLGNWPLARSCLLEMPIPLAGMIWFHLRQRAGQPPHYWKACFICQTTVLTGIFAGQGTLFGTHFYFLLFFLTAPLVVPISDKRGMAIVCAVCLGWFTLLHTLQWPAAPAVSELPRAVINVLNIGVLLSGSIILFIALVAGEYFSELLEHRIQQLASTDSLTGLPNRRAFYAALARQQARHAEEGRPFCLAMLDIDFFKRINDTHGHDTGDAVLRHIAALLQESCGPDDSAARMGGEEFALLLSGASRSEALQRCERLRQTIENSPWQHEAVSIVITTSIGLAPWRAGLSPQDLLAAADQALYAAKRHGRNAVRESQQAAAVC